ncbi:MAG: Ig-like domain-containing protein [Clostridia bacterium]|nr:Ig-like domain-containing protein [Clostridia bacterium]
MNSEKKQHSARAGHKNNPGISRAERRRRRRAAKRRKIIIFSAAVLIVVAAIFAIIFMSGNGDDPVVTAVPTATVSATSEATSEPTSAPVVEATSEPTEEPTAEPVSEATSEATAEPIAEASAAIDLSAIYEGGVRVNGDVASEKLPYQIYISKDTYTIAVLGIDDNGEYTRLLHTWRTAIGTGNKTRAGSYKIDKQYLWYEWSLGGFTPYTSRLDGAKIRLHAPLHNKNEDWNSLWKEGYNQIGTQETQGCLRTTTEGAAWVYFNCSVGTEVLIANDSLYVSDDPPALGDSQSDPTRPVTVDDLEIPVTFFTVDSDILNLTAGGTHQLTVGGVVPTYEEIVHSFKYVSGNEDVVTIDENGLVTAVNPGTTQILVMADDVNMAYRLIDVTVSGN